MKSQWCFVALLLVCASATQAGAGITELSVRTPISPLQAQQQLDALIAVSGDQNLRPELKIVDEAVYAIASMSSTVPRIVISRTYLGKLSRPALRFALAHELAHLHLQHHTHIRSLRSRHQASLSAAPESTDIVSDHTLRGDFHAIEYSADELAMKWCSALGCNLVDAAQALSHAYGARTSETDTHPALDKRLHMLRSGRSFP